MNPSIEKRLTDIEATLKTLLTPQKNAQLIISKPKFQIGQWVKANNGDIFPIDAVYEDHAPMYINSNEVANNNKSYNVKVYIETSLEKWNPEVGEYYVYEPLNTNTKYIAIKKGENDLKTIHYDLIYIAIVGNSVINYSLNGVTDKSDNLRPATQEEKELLHKELEKIGKKFDKETCTLVDTVKLPILGKPAIFWNKRPEAAMIGIYSGKSHKSNYYPLNSLDAYDNAIYCESIEHYKTFIKA